MNTMSPDSAHSGAVRTGQPAWRRFVAVVLIALLSPIPALFAFWADADGDGAPDTWVDPSSGAVFTLSELDSFSWDIDGDGLANAQELALGTDPFVADTDGDGLWDAFDPLPLDSSNSSQANGIVWGAFAMDDADGDGIPNFTDADPYGAGGTAVDPDSDGDGIPDLVDPAPGDPYNIGPTNGFPWMGDALADADGDGVPNFHDWYPYDASRWDEVTDGDNDGIPDGSDPNPNDSSNYSFTNGISWGADAFGDSDADGIANFYDAYPYDSGNGYVPSEPDADGDGIPDSSDPSPWDYYNYSAANGVSWQGDARGDADNDGISNFYDQFPYDYYNGNVPVFDQDADGIPDAEDPAPSDPTNLSPINGGLWHTAALADADGDGNPNFTDPWPYDPTNGNLPPEWNSPTADTDADGIPNAQDPALADPLNFSIYNGTSWYADSIGDVDGDGIINFQDAYPYDYYNGSYAGPDSDGDGMTDSSDPYPNDPNNGNGDADGDGIPDSQDPYPYDSNNGTGGGGDSQPEPDSDGDGIPDSQDAYPYDASNNADFDNDGIPDSSDPAQGDSANSSPINGYSWYGDVRGDADGDGVQNFWDLEPYGPPPVDTDADGLIDSVDPAPEDPRNLSPHNGREWLSDALGDYDGDGVPNFFDAWPDDSMNGVVDSDGDGVPDGTDPSQWDSANLSPYNGVSWGASALGDDDADGIANYFDVWPQDRFNGADADMDGIPDPSDPAPGDSMNYSPHNGRNWYGSEVLGDADNDGILNFFDLYPEDFYNGNPPVYDSDLDGLADNIDPDPDSPYNSSPNNGIAWGDNALGDDDNDGTPNYWDSDPYPLDSDGDGLTDSDDPAPIDPYNYSGTNSRFWPGASALEDLDNDGQSNFYDPEPEGGPPREPDVPQPSASASPLVILNDDYDELGTPPVSDVTPKRDLDDEKLVIKDGPNKGKMATSGLTPFHLAMPPEYLAAGGSVTISKTEGDGSVRVHAVRTKEGVAEEHVVPFGSPYVPRAGGGWGYWIEGVTEGPVILKCHFPQKTYGSDSLHPYGVMGEDADVRIEFKVVRVWTAPAKVRANGNFDEGRLDDATGFALKDSEDDDLKADRDSFHDQNVKAGKIVTTDLAEGFFGIIPADLPSGAGQGASIMIKKIETKDAETDRPCPGVVRLYAIRNLGEQDEQAMVILQNVNLAPVLYGPDASIFMGKGEGVRYWIEGVEPGKLTLELTIKLGDLEYSQKHEMTVVTEQDKAAWQREVRNEILLESGGTVDIAKYTVGSEPAVDPSGEWPFMMNRPNVQAVFRHYEKIYRIGPDKFQWAGLGKLAGAPVYAGLSDAQHGRANVIEGIAETLRGLISNEKQLVSDAKDLVKSTQALLVYGNIRIFEDLAWQFAAYRCSGLGALHYVDMQNSKDSEVLSFDDWALIDSGIKDRDVEKILRGNKELARREQEVVLKPVYEGMDTLQLSLDSSFLPEDHRVGVSKAFSFLAKNPVPGGPRFIPADLLSDSDSSSLDSAQNLAGQLVIGFKIVVYSSESRRISRFEERWDWIEREGDGMWPLWTKTPKDQAISLVSIPLQKRAEDYVILKKFNVW